MCLLFAEECKLNVTHIKATVLGHLVLSFLFYFENPPVRLLVFASVMSADLNSKLFSADGRFISVIFLSEKAPLKDLFSALYVAFWFPLWSLRVS